MKDLTKAYNQVYQLDEVKFSNVGGTTNVMRAFRTSSDSKTPPPAPQLPPPATTTTTQAKPQPSAMDQWRAANPKLAAAADEKARIRGTNQTDNPLIDAGMRARMPAPTKSQDPNFQTTMKSDKYGDQGHQRLTQNPYVKPVSSSTNTSAAPAPAPTALATVSQAAQASINRDSRAQSFDTSKWFSNRSTTNDRKRPLLQTQMNSYDYGQIDQEQLSSMVDAYTSMYANQEEEVETEELEEKRGLWDNIHAKRKRGERPAKPGEEGYPKTLNVEENELEEGLKQARKNVGAGKCWDGYKAKGTKMKGGKEVPNCVPEAYDIILDHLMSEGYANTVESAEKIMGVMSDNWMSEILNEFNAGMGVVAPPPMGTRPMMPGMF